MKLINADLKTVADYLGKCQIYAINPETEDKSAVEIGKELEKLIFLILVPDEESNKKSDPKEPPKEKKRPGRKPGQKAVAKTPSAPNH